MVVSWNGGNPKSSIYRGINHYKPLLMTFPRVVFDRIFRYKPSILGYPLTVESLFLIQRPLSTGIPKTAEELTGSRGPGWSWADCSHLGMTEEYRGILPFESFWMVYFKAWELMKQCFFSKKKGSKWIQMVENHGGNSQWFGNYMTCFFLNKKLLYVGMINLYP